MASPVEQAEEAVKDAAGKVARPRRGQGFQLDQEVKVAVGTLAMNSPDAGPAPSGRRGQRVRLYGAAHPGRYGQGDGKQDDAQDHRCPAEYQARER
jgi:hypothetical protein